MDERAPFTSVWERESTTTRRVLERMPEGAPHRPDPASRRLDLGGRERSASAMAWSLPFDIVHHRGRITTDVRPMGSTVPLVYGPSADES